MRHGRCSMPDGGCRVRGEPRRRRRPARARRDFRPLDAIALGWARLGAAGRTRPSLHRACADRREVARPTPSSTPRPARSSRRGAASAVMASTRRSVDMIAVADFELERSADGPSRNTRSRPCSTAASSPTPNATTAVHSRGCRRGAIHAPGPDDDAGGRHRDPVAQVVGCTP